MLGLIGMMITMIVVMLAIKTKVEETSDYVRHEIADFKENFFSRMISSAFQNKDKVGGVAASAVSGFILSKLRQKFAKR